MPRLTGWALLGAYVATIPAANWLIGHVGTVCAPAGPCLVSVWPGILAPSGVLLAGLALVLRDLVQRAVGVRWSVAAILIGTVVSAAVASPAILFASASAFLLSELADLAVYTPLQRRGLALAVAASGVVGLFVDSVWFLLLAFGSLDHLAGQVIGKAWMVGAAVVAIGLLRRRVPVLG